MVVTSSAIVVGVVSCNFVGGYCYHVMVVGGGSGGDCWWWLLRWL